MLVGAGSVVVVAEALARKLEEKPPKQKTEAADALGGILREAGKNLADAMIHKALAPAGPTLLTPKSTAPALPGSQRKRYRGHRRAGRGHRPNRGDAK
jgi:hypothetical protein